MSIFFLPLDIDVSELTFTQEAESTKASAWMEYWNASFISEDTVAKNGLDQIIKQLPFVRITRLFHKIQTTAVPSHLDVQPKMILEDGEMDHIKSLEPAGYRIVLKGQTDSLSVYTGENWINTTLPSVPCCYLLNSTTAYHKLKEDFNRETIYIRGYLDSVKHQELINRSLIKFKDYAVYKHQ
jgi:hypothetical protein